jgi:hypothetical protein
MTKNTRHVLFGLLLGVFSGATTHAATYTAATCGSSDVQAAINAAANGDTVTIPSGSCTWASGISTTKQITLQGATTPTRNATATDGVTITAAVGSGVNLMAFTIGSSARTTIANIRFLPGSSKANAYISINGTGLAPSMHDMYFNIPNFQLNRAVEWFVTGGVVWNTTFDSTFNLAGACGTQVGSDSGSFVVKSNKKWDDASTMGTLDVSGDQNLYIEDSIFSYVGQMPDLDDNSRVVLRHNQISNSSGLTHGPTGQYGGRHIELYGNTFSFTNINRPLTRYFWFRAGTAVITQNSIQAINAAPCYQNASSFQFIVESATRNTSHGCCTGYMCWHQPGSGSDGTTHSQSYLSSSQTPTDAYQSPDPVYIWNNTGTGQAPGRITSVNDSDMSCNTGNTTGTFFVLNRDYFVDTTSSPSSGAKPGWAPYTYPHPLRSGSGGDSGGSPVPPTQVRATVQ